MEFLSNLDAGFVAGFVVGAITIKYGPDLSARVKALALQGLAWASKKVGR